MEELFGIRREEVLRSVVPENKPLMLEQLRQIKTSCPLYKEETPSGDMTVSVIEPVLFNGVCCGKEERVCWVIGAAHRANARTEHIIAGKINFYARKLENPK